jgi:DoxX-like family
LFIATAVLSGLLAFVFGAGAVGKLTAMRSEVDKSTKLKIPWPRYRLIAIPEAAAAVGLLAGLGVAPLGVAAAVGLVALMAGALAFASE